MNLKIKLPPHRENRLDAAILARPGEEYFPAWVRKNKLDVNAMPKTGAPLPTNGGLRDSELKSNSKPVHYDVPNGEILSGEELS